MEMSPSVKKALEAMGCSNTADPEDAEKLMLAFLKEAQEFVDTAVAKGVPPMVLVRRAAIDLPRVIMMTRMITDEAMISGKKEGVETSALCKLLAVIATSATCVLKDMAFLGRAGISGKCAGCDRKDDCDIGKSSIEGG